MDRRGTMVREERHWLKRSITGKRGESLGRRGTLVREERHWLKRRVTGKRGEPLGRRGTLVRKERHWLERASLVKEQSYWVDEGHWSERSITG